MRQIRYSTVHASFFMYMLSPFMADHLTTSLALAPNSLFRLLEFKISLGASLTPRALFLVRIVLTVALNRAVRSIIYFLRPKKKIVNWRISNIDQAFHLVTPSNLLGSQKCNFTTVLHDIPVKLVPFQSNGVLFQLVDGPLVDACNEFG